MHTTPPPTSTNCFKTDALRRESDADRAAIV
jgi:hypothetical protein